MDGCLVVKAVLWIVCINQISNLAVPDAFHCVVVVVLVDS